MTAHEKAAGLCRTYEAYRRLAAITIEGPGCRVVRADDAPTVYDSNHLQVDPGADPDAVLRFFEEHLGDKKYRQVLATSFTDPAMEARLAHEGYEAGATLQGLLTGELQGAKPPNCDIRPIATDDDWRRLHQLARANHLEVDQKRGSHVFTIEVTRDILAVRRASAPDVQFFLAFDAGEAVAFFSSYPGIDGVGMVEDLFTLPSHRGRGIARALIHHCVADARARGAREVLIGSHPEETPKQLYAAMGFAPTCLTWNWLKQLD